MNGRGEHVRHRVSLVLELWDDFTDRPISDPSVVITASGLIRPLRKEDGFYVFVNCPMPVHVEIRSERYETEEFDAGMQDGKAVILKKRLRPGKNYPLPAGTTCVIGCAEPGTVIEVAAEESSSSMLTVMDTAGWSRWTMSRICSCSKLRREMSSSPEEPISCQRKSPSRTTPT